jgi:hypothetical protein
MAARKADRESGHNLQNKYHSIDSKNDHDKIEALKDIKLNPYRLKDPYDGLSNSLNRWKHVANDAVLNHYTDEQKAKVAGNYYDKMIAPMYAGMNQAPMSKELWLKQAFKEATEYNIEDAYNNSIIHDLKHGLDSGLAATARATSYVTDSLTNKFNTAMGEFFNAKKQGTTGGAWFVNTPGGHSRGIENNEPAFKPSEEDIVTKGAHMQADNHQFWADALPDKGGWIAKATGFVAEQAGQLPVYAAMALGGEAIGAAGVSNLTSSLLKNPLGKRAVGYLMAGGEGLAYGKLTRPQEDKGQAWRDAVGFAVFHGVFDVAGMGLKKITEVANKPDVLEKLKRKQDFYESTEEGKLRLATAEEKYIQHKKEVSNNLAVVGIAGQKKIFTDALHHISDMEGRGWTKEQVKDHELRLLNADPARFSPVFSSAKYVRSLLGATGKQLGEITEGSEEEKYISSRIAKLIFDAGSEMHQHVDGIKEITEKSVAAAAKEPSAKHTIDFYRAKVATQLAKENPAAVKMMKPEEIEAMAVKAMAKDTQKALEEAEKKLATDPTTQATEMNKRAKAPKVQNVPAVKVRSERTLNKYGEPAVRYSVNTDFKVALKAYMKTAKDKGQILSEFFEGMEDKDFVNDLSTHFYPQALKDSKVFFEEQNTKEGAQNPNFLGFMYNYIDQMPEEFGKALEERLVESMKLQKYMNGRRAHRTAANVLCASYV